MPKIKILFIAYQTPNSSNGGMESATRIFELLQSDFDWLLLTNRETRFTERWRRGEATIRIISAEAESSRLIRILGMGKMAFAARRLIKRERPDIVHANDIRAGIAATALSGSSGPPFLITERDVKPSDDPYGKHWRWVTARCRRVVTLSHEMSEALSRRIGLSTWKLKCIHSVVDLDRMNPPIPAERIALRRDLGLDPGEFAIGSVGAFMPKKAQLPLIIQGLPRLLREIPNATIHFLGDFEPDRNPYAKQCLDAATNLAFDQKIRFHGYTHNIAQWYKALDVIIVPSMNEGLARCMIEAMSSATPVVSFDVCSAREMLETTGAGAVACNGDYESLVDELVKLSSDQSLCEAMGKAGREAAVQLFSAARTMAAYRSLYEEIRTGK